MVQIGEGVAVGRRALARARLDEEVEHLADRALTVRRPGQWEVLLDLVAVTTPVPLLDDVPGGGEVGDDAVRAAFGDAERGRDVAEPDSRIVRDRHQRTRMIRQKAPLRHSPIL